MSAPIPPFQAFMDEHRDAVWRFLASSLDAGDADECFQETFIAALRAYPRLQAARGEHNLRAWVLTIAHRKALDAHRGRARRALPVADPAEHDARVAHDGRAHAQQARPGGGFDEQLSEAVRALPPRQRSAVVLRYVADLAHSEIAAAIGCSEQAARRSLHEGLEKLRKEIEE